MYEFFHVGVHLKYHYYATKIKYIFAHPNVLVYYIYILHFLQIFQEKSFCVTSA